MRRGQLLPGLRQRRQRILPAVFVSPAGIRQPTAPGLPLQLGQLGISEHLALAQLRQQTEQRRPIAALYIQLLQLTQYQLVVGVTLVHHLQGLQRRIGLTPRQLQFGMGQTDRQLGLRLPRERLLQQLITVLLLPQLLRGTSGPQVICQGLFLAFGGSAQVAQGRRPTTFGQIEKTLLAGQTHAAPAMQTRPGIDQPSRGDDQTQQQAQQVERQPDHRDQRQESPQARFVAKAPVSEQHVALVLGYRQGEQRQPRGYRQHDEQQIDTLHGRASSTLGKASAAASRSTRCRADCLRWI